jgi:outer membrane receptor protein involved in Fe transport
VPDIYEQPRNSLDANLSFGLPGGVRATLRGTNLLDATYLFDQSLNGITQIQRRYTIGRTLSVGLTWEL